MPSHDPLLSDRTKDKNADMAMVTAMVREGSPWKNTSAALTTISVSTVAYPDILLSIAPLYQILDLVPVFDHKAADLPSNKSIPFQKKGWRNCHLKMKAKLTSLPLTNLSHWSNSI